MWGAKTVRGAYMHVERARAAEMGYDSPIQDTIEQTHANYNRHARCGGTLLCHLYCDLMASRPSGVWQQ